MAKGKEVAHASLAAGALIGVSAVCCPCPACVSTAAIFLGNGIAMKLRR